MPLSFLMVFRLYRIFLHRDCVQEFGFYRAKDSGGKKGYSDTEVFGGLSERSERKFHIRLCEDVCSSDLRDHYIERISSLRRPEYKPSIINKYGGSPGTIISM